MYDIVNETDFEVDEPHYSALLDFLLKELRLPKIAYLSLSFVSIEQMQELNKDFRGYNEATDVLSFPVDFLGYKDNKTEISSESDVIGDIIVCPQYVKQHPTQKELYDEIDFLIIHSMLHLLGHDHEILHEKEVMWASQDSLYKKFHLNH